MRFKPSLRHKATSAAGVTRLGSALAFQGITAAELVIVQRCDEAQHRASRKRTL